MDKITTQVGLSNKAIKNLSEAIESINETISDMDLQAKEIASEAGGRDGLIALADKLASDLGDFEVL